MKVLVVAAWEPELARFRELAHERLSSVGWIVVDPVGIGLVEAAVGMTRKLIEHRPRHVVFIGTCGAARPGLAALDVVLASRVALVDPAAGFEGTALLHSIAHDVVVDPELRGSFVAAGARPVDVANSLGITTTDAFVTRVASTGHVEHIEAYGVSKACAEQGVSCAIALGVANDVGAKGREQWKANHVAASARVAEVACDALVAYFSRTSTKGPTPA